MSPDGELATTQQATRQDLATVPARPQIESREMYTGGPFVLGLGTGTGMKHGLGWIERSERRAAPVSSSSGSRSPTTSVPSTGSR
jgi:hypothetical protein